MSLCWLIRWYFQLRHALIAKTADVELRLRVDNDPVVPAWSGGRTCTPISEIATTASAVATVSYYLDDCHTLVSRLVVR